MKYTAQLARRRQPGNRARWVLYVCIIPGSVSDWPEHMWPARRTAVPTLAERRSELERLGYTTPKDEAWEWTEDEDAEGVTLIGSTAVVPLDGEAP